MTDMCAHLWQKLRHVDMQGDCAVLVACGKCGRRDVVRFPCTGSGG